ncbi:5-formyltetrahydrofolate cyclo-ligase-like protein [Sporodiniella umbellata]|nr:5-formyltetrahydrofolate cyclo-ligase-like protein [Sporodiniella umbellata]
MQPTLVHSKRQLRKHIASVLQRLSPAETLNQSQQVFERLQTLEGFQNAKNISIYVSMPTGEIVTTEMIRYLLRLNKNCFIPRCSPQGMEMVKIHSLQDFESLPLNRWNIPEPPKEQRRENALETSGLELVLVPGVAFDAERNRIGHGKGQVLSLAFTFYYDRYLTQCDQWAQQNHTTPPNTIALALDQQIVEVGRIPLEETDRALDMVLSPSYLFSK